MKLAYDIYEPPVGNGMAPVIFLHCAVDSKKTWKYVAPAIARNTRRKVYALDARNHGESPRSEEMDYDVIVDDMEEFFDDNNIPKAILVGHSMGGRVAMILALKKPERVEKLVVEDTTPGVLKLSSRSWLMLNTLKNILNVIPPGLSVSEAREFLVEFFFSMIPLNIMPKDRFLACNDTEMIPLIKVDGEYRWEVDLNALEKFIHLHTFLPQLSGVYPGPTLFLYGSRSLFKLEKDDVIQRLFPRAILRKIEGAGHYIHNEFLEEYVKHVSDFINGNIQKTTLSRY